MSGQGEIRTHGTVAGTPVFETGAFNHSATCPGQPKSLARGGRGVNESCTAPLGEEVAQERAALRLEYAACHLGPMVQAWMAQQVANAADHARLLVPCAEHDARDACEHD